MSRYHHRQPPIEQGNARQPQAKFTRVPRTDVPHRKTSPERAGLPDALWQAGNSAISALIGDVPVHTESAARAEADSLGAAAFTRGGEIYLGSQSPPLDSLKGQSLLAHEMTHVMQQRAAGARDDGRINEPGDAFERAAEAGAVQPAGTPPGTQRQMANLLDRAQIVARIQTLLEEILKAQGGKNLKIDNRVKVPLMKLAKWPDPRRKGIDPKASMRETTMKDMLDSSMHSSTPEGLAREAAKILPQRMDPAAFQELKVLSTGPSKKGLERAVEIFDKTTPSPRPDDPSKRKGEKPPDTTKTGPSVPVSQVVDVVEEAGKTKPKGSKEAQRVNPTQPTTSEGKGPANRPPPGRSAAQWQPPKGLVSLGWRLETAQASVIDAFPLGSAALGQHQREQLDRFAAFVNLVASTPNPDIEVDIDIVGHTDTTGTERRNQTLSQQRADAVRNYLVKTRGIDELKVRSVTGAGATQAHIPELTESDRMRNRRVEVSVRTRAALSTKRPFH